MDDAQKERDRIIEERDKLFRNYQSLKHSNARLHDVVHKLEAQESAKDPANARLLEVVNKLESQASAKDSKILSLQESHANLSETVEKLQSQERQLTQLQESHASLSETLESQRLRLQERGNDSQNANLSSIKRENERLERVVHKLEAQARANDSDLMHELKVEASEWKSQMFECHALKERVSKQDSDLAALKTLEMDLCGHRAESQRSISDLRDQVARGDEAAECRQQMDAQESIISELRDQLAREDEAAECRQQIDAEEKLAEGAACISALQSDKAELQETISSLRMLLVKASETSEQVSDLSQTLECNALQERVLHVEAEWAAMKTLETDACDRAAELQRTNDKLSQGLDEQANARDLMEELKSTEQEVQTLSDAQQQSAKEIGKQMYQELEYAAEWATMKTLETEACDRAAELQRTTEKLAQRLGDASDRAAELQRTNDKLAQGLGEQVNGTDKIVISWEAKAGDLREELKSTEQEVRTLSDAQRQSAKEIEQLAYQEATAHDGMVSWEDAAQKVMEKLQTMKHEVQALSDAQRRSSKDEVMIENLKRQESTIQEGLVSWEVAAQTAMDKLKATEHEFQTLSASQQNDGNENQILIEKLMHEESTAREGLESWEAATQKVMEDLNTTRSDLEGLCESQRGERKEIERLSHQESTAQRELVSWETEAQKVTEDLITSQREKTELCFELESCESRGESNSCEGEVSMAAVEMQLETFYKTLAEKSESMTEVEQRLAAAQADNIKWDAQVTELRSASIATAQEMAKVEQKLAEVEAEKLKLVSQERNAKGLQAEHDEAVIELEKEFTELRGALFVKSENMAKVELKLAAAQSETAELHSAKDDVRRLEAECDDVTAKSEGEVGQLRAEVVDLCTEMFDLRNAQAESRDENLEVIRAIESEMKQRKQGYETEERLEEVEAQLAKSHEYAIVEQEARFQAEIKEHNAEMMALKKEHFMEVSKWKIALKDAELQQTRAGMSPKSPAMYYDDVVTNYALAERIEGIGACMFGREQQAAEKASTSGPFKMSARPLAPSASQPSLSPAIIRDNPRGSPPDSSRSATTTQLHSYRSPPHSNRSGTSSQVAQRAATQPTLPASVGPAPSTVALQHHQIRRALASARAKLGPGILQCRTP